MIEPPFLEALFEEAARLGFSSGAFLPLHPPAASFRQSYEGYLKKGYFADMGYLQNTGAKFNPQMMLEGAKSMFVFALPYLNREVGARLREADYRIARYAWGLDYHQVVKVKLHSLIGRFSDELEGCRIVCDSTPLPERYYGRLANLGFIGRNGMLINPQRGSFFLLSFILSPHAAPDAPRSEATTFFEISPGSSIDTSINLSIEPAVERCGREVVEGDIERYCGSCSACVESCPGRALQGDGLLDASRCFSYWSIEKRRGDIEIDSNIEGWVFGCDICQEVCPYNAPALKGALDLKSDSASEFEPGPQSLAISRGRMEEVGSLKGTSFSRIGKMGIARNLHYVDTKR